MRILNSEFGSSKFTKGIFIERAGTMTEVAGEIMISLAQSMHVNPHFAHEL